MELVIFLAILIMLAVCAFFATGPVDKQVPTSCIDCLYFADNCCCNELSDYYAFNACSSSWCDLGIQRPEDPE